MPDSDVLRVIEGGYCIGCGGCAAVAPDAFFIGIDAEGMKQATTHGPPGEPEAQRADTVCPFSDAARNETEIAAALFPDLPEDRFLGRHDAIFAGHVAEGDFRARGSSGGGVSWLIHELFARGQIDFVVHVGEGAGGNGLFEYRVSRSAEEACAETKSKYYPISLEKVIPAVLAEEGRGLFVGIPCFVKTLRNLAAGWPELDARIAYAAGLVCGHMKTAQFAENFAWQMGCPPGQLEAIDFRHVPPDHDGAANHYYVRIECRDGSEQIAQNRTLFGFNWGMGFFKPKACDYCDDVFAETADITFGDAWIAPYVDDPQGDNIIVSRSAALTAIVQEAVRDGRLAFEPLGADAAAQSQWAGIRHRRDGTRVRVAARRARGEWVPAKRVEVQPFVDPPDLRQKLVYRVREHISARSRTLFAQAVARRSYRYFYVRMRALTLLYTKVLNRRRRRPPQG